MLFRSLKILPLVVFGWLFWIEHVENFQYEVPRADRRHYLAMAYNLVQYGTVSMSERDMPNPEPSTYRSPGHPFILALALAAHPELRAMQWSEFFQPESLEWLAPIYHMQLFLALVAFFASATLVLTLTKSWLAVYLFCFLNWYSFNSIVRYPGSLYAENTIILFLVLASLFAVIAVQRGSYLSAAAAGLSLGMLALTSPPFYYGWILLTILLGIGGFKAVGARQGVYLAAVFAILFWLPVGSWMVRNYVHFGAFQISEGRGGQVIAWRAKDFNSMTLKEWMASFVYFAPKHVQRKHLERHFAPEDYRRLDRSNLEDGFYQTGRRRLPELREELGLTSIEVDRMLKKEGLQLIMEHPLKHLAVTVAIGHRGMQITPFYSLNITLFFALFVFFFWGVLRLKTDWLAASLLPVFSFAFYAGLTHYITRYSQPLVPLLWVCAAVLLYSILAAVLERVIKPLHRV